MQSITGLHKRDIDHIGPALFERLERTKESPRGSETNFATAVGVVAKFEKLAAHALPARSIESVVDAVLANPATRTVDLGGSFGTQGFAEAVAAKVQ